MYPVDGVGILDRDKIADMIILRVRSSGKGHHGKRTSNQQSLHFHFPSFRLGSNLMKRG
jgi:hypothetical protein